MSLSTQNQAANYQRRIAVLKSQSIVEIRLSGQDIGEVTAVYPQVSLNTCEPSNGRVSYSGRLICTAVYTDGDGKLCRMQKGAEFSHYCDDDCLVPAANVQCALKAEKATVKRDGSSYVIAVVIGAQIEVYANAERNILVSAEGAVVNTETKKLASAVTFSGESEVEDDFECNVSDVLVPAAEALVTNCVCGGGSVEISGEIYLSLLAVRDSKPVCLDRIVPFKCEIGCDGALISKNAFCKAEIKEITVNAKVNEERGKCDVTATATLGFTGIFYDEEETLLVTDAFCSDCELKFGYAEEDCAPDIDTKVYSERIGGLCATKAKLDYTCAFLAACLPKAEFQLSDGGIEGGVSFTLLYEQGGDIRSTEVNLPFSVALTGLGKNCCDIGVAVCGVNIRQRSEGECEAEAVLKISATECASERVKYITQAEEGEKIKANDCAVSVYIPAKGDCLWDTAKKLKQSPDEIKATNPDLNFPLTGNERILIFRAKAD